MRLVGQQRLGYATVEVRQTLSVYLKLMQTLGSSGNCQPIASLANERKGEDATNMVEQIIAYEFSDTAFVVGSDPVVCVIPFTALKSYMTLGELDDAFSGYASYRQAPWMKRYVGVWGRKNCQRLRRFLRERGADIVIHRERPLRLKLARYKTRRARKKVRNLKASTDH